MDVIFYFVISLLVSTVLCYLIFVLKIYLQGQQIKDLDGKIESVGTDVQKKQEETVFSLQKKINDYAVMLTDHELSSSIFGFLEKTTLPNVWFSQFSMGTKQGKITLLGVAESMDALSRQTASLEKSEFITKVDLLGSSVGESGKVNFSLNLTLDPKIFGYVPPLPESETTPEDNPATVNPEENGELPSEVKSSEKQILSFDLPLNPEVVGAIDQTNRTIALNVPLGTDVTNLSPLINISPKASVSPVSNISQNFTNSVIYTVSAEDGSLQQYTATVNAVAEGGAESGSSKNMLIITIGVIVAVVVVIALGLFFFLKKRSKNKKIAVENNGN